MQFLTNSTPLGRGRGKIEEAGGDVSLCICIYMNSPLPSCIFKKHCYIFWWLKCKTEVNIVNFG